MSKLRPECGTATKSNNLPERDFFRQLYYSVKSRRVLAHGKLHAKDGLCAMGCFWEDNPKITVPVDITDQVAAVNDSVPPTATRSERRRHVLRWLEWKLGL